MSWRHGRGEGRMLTSPQQERVMVVTVYLRTGASARVSSATTVQRGSFLLSGSSPADGDAVAALELRDDKSNVVGTFLLSEVVGYVIESEMSLEGITAAARATASSV